MTRKSHPQPKKVFNACIYKQLPFLFLGLALCFGAMIYSQQVPLFGLLLVAIFLMNSSVEIVRIHPTHTELKLSAIRPRHLIPNQDITHAEIHNSTLLGRVIKLSFNKNNKSITKTIHLKPFDKKAAQIVEKHFLDLALANSTVK